MDPALHSTMFAAGVFSYDEKFLEKDSPMMEYVQELCTFKRVGKIYKVVGIVERSHGLVGEGDTVLAIGVHAGCRNPAWCASVGFKDGDTGYVRASFCHYFGLVKRTAIFGDVSCRNLYNGEISYSAGVSHRVGNGKTFKVKLNNDGKLSSFAQINHGKWKVEIGGEVDIRSKNGDLRYGVRGDPRFGVRVSFGGSSSMSAQATSFAPEVGDGKVNVCGDCDPKFVVSNDNSAAQEGDGKVNVCEDLDPKFAVSNDNSAAKTNYGTLSSFVQKLSSYFQLKDGNLEVSIGGNRKIIIGPSTNRHNEPVLGVSISCESSFPTEEKGSSSSDGQKGKK